MGGSDDRVVALGVGAAILVARRVGAAGRLGKPGEAGVAGATLGVAGDGGGALASTAAGGTVRSGVDGGGGAVGVTWAGAVGGTEGALSGTEPGAVDVAAGGGGTLPRVLPAGRVVGGAEVRIGTTGGTASELVAAVGRGAVGALKMRVAPVAIWGRLAPEEGGGTVGAARARMFVFSAGTLGSNGAGGGVAGESPSVRTARLGIAGLVEGIGGGGCPGRVRPANARQSVNKRVFTVEGGKGRGCRRRTWGSKR
jgi:hypothetical protein